MNTWHKNSTMFFAFFLSNNNWIHCSSNEIYNYARLLFSLAWVGAGWDAFLKHQHEQSPFIQLYTGAVYVVFCILYFVFCVCMEYILFSWWEKHHNKKQQQKQQQHRTYRHTLTPWCLTTNALLSTVYWVYCIRIEDARKQ